MENTPMNFYKLCMIFVLFSPLVWGGGFRVEGSGAEETGSAGAITTRISGGMALFTNPANIGNIQKIKGEVLFGASSFFQRGFYSNIGKSTWRSDASTQHSPYGAFMYSLNDRLAFAAGYTETYNHFFEWNDPQFVGRYTGTGQEMTVTETAFGASYQTGKNWAIGLSLRQAKADFSYQVSRVRPLYGAETFPDLFYDYSDVSQANDSGTGFSLGVLFTPRFGMKFAITYFSKIDFDFSGTHSVELSQDVSNVRIQTDFSNFSYQNEMRSSWSIPDRLTLGGSFRTTVRTRLEVDLSYEDWKTNENIQVQTSDENGVPIVFNLGESWKSVTDFAAGTEFRQNPDLTWRAGLAYRLHVLSSEDLTPGYPVFDRFTTSIGLAYRFGKNVLEFGYSYIQYRDVKVGDQEWVVDINSPDFLISNTQRGLFESQRHHLALGYRRQF